MISLISFHVSFFIHGNPSDCISVLQGAMLRTYTITMYNDYRKDKKKKTKLIQRCYTSMIFSFILNV